MGDNTGGPERRRERRFGVALVVAALGALTGCGSRPAEQPPVPPRRGEVVRPVTTAVLSLMPDSSAVAVAVPHPADTFSRWLGFVREAAPDPAAVDAQAAALAHAAAILFGVPNARSLSEVALARGIDPESPVALFVDVSPSGEDGAPGTGRGAPDVVSRGADRVLSMLGVDPTQAPDPIRNSAAFAGPMDFAVALQCTDPALAQATLDEMLAGAAEDASSGPGTLNVHGVTIRHYAPGAPCHFTAGRRLVVGNSLSIVAGVAAKLRDPAEPRYGTVVCPAGAREEIVKLVRMDKLRPVLDRVLPGLGDSGPGQSETLLARILKPLVEAHMSPDPVVVTLLLNDERLELVTRVDYATHPGLRDLTGDPVPLRHLALLPEDVAAVADFGLSENARAALADLWIAAMPVAMAKDPRFAQVSGMVRRITALVGDEVTVAVTDEPDASSAVLVLMALADVNEAREFLATFGADPSPFDTLDDIEILAFPEPVGAQYAFTGKTFVASTDLGLVKATLERIRNRGGRRRPEAWQTATVLEHPIDPALPRFRFVLIESSFITRTAGPAAHLAGLITDGQLLAISGLASRTTQVRWTMDMAGTWRESRLTLHRNSPSGE